jgi:hypothetical protein
VDGSLIFILLALFFHVYQLKSPDPAYFLVSMLNCVFFVVARKTVVYLSDSIYGLRRRRIRSAYTILTNLLLVCA